MTARGTHEERIILRSDDRHVEVAVVKRLEEANTLCVAQQPGDKRISLGTDAKPAGLLRRNRTHTPAAANNDEPRLVLALVFELRNVVREDR